MIFFIVLSFATIPLSLACRPEGYWWPPPQDNKKRDKYFSPEDSWGGWKPPPDNNEWREWIEKWGKHRTTDRPESDEWGSERGPGSGWPQHWRGYGLGIGGVPPPPWAYVPESYDKAQFCFHMPKFGHCSENVTRWGFNPSRNECQKFFYSGCGGNQNNFISKARCEAACVATAAADCVDQPGVDLEELIDQQFTPQEVLVKHNRSFSQLWHNLAHTEWDSEEKK